MSKRSIYLDYNATAPMRPTVRECMLEALTLPLNPSSLHRMGAEAKKRLDAARKTIADAICVFPNEIIFTASGTEANTLALRGFQGRPIVTTVTEHASVANTASLLGAATVKVYNCGKIILPMFEKTLQSLGKPALVSVILANNETGVIQSMREIADIAHHYGALVHCDAVQAFGKIPLDMGLLGVDMMTISAHKVGGPVGIAALVLRNDIPIKPLFAGGRQELGRRAGTESVALIKAFAKLAEEVASASDAARLEAMRNAMEYRLMTCSPFLAAAGDEPRLPNTSMICMPGVPSETQLMHFDLAGFCVSAGSACSSGRIEPSHVLTAMGKTKEEAGQYIRVSTGWDTKEADVEAFTDCWLELYQRLGDKNLGAWMN